MKFEYGTSYPIETLPDDLYDQTIPNRDRWAIKEAMFWNDCQGWWLESILRERQRYDFGESSARFWTPLPPDPITREQVLSERGYAGVCPDCDYAVRDFDDHTCQQESVKLVAEQRRLQAIADGKL